MTRASTPMVTIAATLTTTTAMAATVSGAGHPMATGTPLMLPVAAHELASVNNKLT